MDKRIGAQLYTVREYCKTIEDVDKTYEKLSKIGYKTVQASGVNTELTGAELKAVADKYGIETICTHRGYNEYTEDLDKLIKFHKDLNCNIAGLGAAPGDLRTSTEGLKNFIKDFNKISGELKKEGITFGYHNHAFEFLKVDGKYVMDYLIEETDPDSFKFILDVYWLAFAGVNPAKYIRKMGDRAMVIHFKDIKALSTNAVTMCEVGKGNIDWDEVIAACEDAGCIAAMVEQDRCDEGADPFDCLKDSYDFLCTKGFN